MRDDAPEGPRSAANPVIELRMRLIEVRLLEKMAGDETDTGAADDLWIDFEEAMERRLGLLTAAEEGGVLAWLQGMMEGE